MSESDRSDSFEPADAAAECRRICGGGEQCLVAEMDMQHHLRPHLALIDTGRPDDQGGIKRLLRRLSL